MKTIAVLRAYPKDNSLGKIVGYLSREYRVTCFIWDRQRDYQPIVKNENVVYRSFCLRAGYYDLATFLKLFLFQIWLFCTTLFAKLDVIHAIDLDTGFVGFCVAKLRRKPFVYQCLDPYFTALPKGWPPILAVIARGLENFVISRADLFVITDLLRLPQHEGARPKRLVEIANVPYLDVLPLEKRAEECFVVGYIGSLSPGRSLPELIDAIDELRNEGVSLVLGGFGPLADQLAAQILRLGNVRFVSWVPIAELYTLERTFDVFVYLTDGANPAYRWLSGNKLFESMAFGRPIIVSEGTLVAQRVAAMSNGIAVPYGDRQALKQAILILMKNKTLAREMGKKGALEYERNWRPEVMAKRLVDAYGEVWRHRAGTGNQGMGT